MVDGNRNLTDTHTCRVCLHPNLRRSKSLFEEFMSETICTYVNKIAEVHMSREDGFPDKICYPCFNQLETAINFKQKCQASHATLLALNIKTESEEVLENELEDFKVEESIEYNEPDFEEDPYDNSDEQEIPNIEIKLELEKPNLSQLAEQQPRPSKAVDLKLECHDCGGIFKSKVKLHVHWKRIHLPQQLICTICKKKFGTFRTLNLHRSKQPKSCKAASYALIEGVGKERIYKCKLCKYETKLFGSWKQHLTTHSGERNFKCDLCEARYTQRSSLHKHRESFHKLYKTQVTCHICGKLIKGKSALQYHIWTHKHNQTVECKICGKQLKKNSMKVHLDMHSNDKSFACEYCAFSTYSLAILITHKKSVHSTNRKWFHCDLCEYKSRKKYTINKHKDKHKSNNFPCTVCGRFYTSEKTLLKHKLNHFAERTFECNFCSKSFLINKNLGKHIRGVHKLKYGLSEASSTQANTISKKDRKKEACDNNKIPEKCKDACNSSLNSS